MLRCCCLVGCRFACARCFYWFVSCSVVFVLFVFIAFVWFGRARCLFVRFVGFVCVCWLFACLRVCCFRSFVSLIVRPFVLQLFVCVVLSLRVSCCLLFVYSCMLVCFCCCLCMCFIIVYCIIRLIIYVSFCSFGCLVVVVSLFRFVLIYLLFVFLLFWRFVRVGRSVRCFVCLLL